MILRDIYRTLPEVWTDERCVELFEHARDLGLHGNPGGYMLTVALFPFVGIEDEMGRILRPWSEWDYDGMRAWIADHPEEVLLAWQRYVESDSF